jgi:hypothetical protein
VHPVVLLWSEELEYFKRHSLCDVYMHHGAKNLVKLLLHHLSTLPIIDPGNLRNTDLLGSKY